VQHRQLLSQSNEAKFDMDASLIHERWCDAETMELITAHISTMLQQDLDNLILVLRDSQVQGCPAVIEWIHTNALGQQKPHSLAVAWGQKDILAQTPIQTQQGLLQITGWWLEFATPRVAQFLRLAFGFQHNILQLAIHFQLQIPLVIDSSLRQTLLKLWQTRNKWLATPYSRVRHVWQCIYGRNRNTLKLNVP